MDKKQMVHDLALIHAQAKYQEYFNSVPPSNRPFQSDICELVDHYTFAVTLISNHIDEIEEAYSADDGTPIFSFE